MLRYTGGGYGGWLPGIPARDLTDEQVEAYGGVEFLVGTGLYEVTTEVVTTNDTNDTSGEDEEVDDGGK